MVFGKKREEQDSSQIEEQFGINIQNLDDSVNEQEVEHIEVTEEDNTRQPQKNRTQEDQLQVDAKLKPLLNEVNLIGAAQGKNPGGSKSWSCKHCGGKFTSSYTRMHYHFFGAPPGKKTKINDVKR